jgi:serine/threonine protein kinase
MDFTVENICGFLIRSRLLSPDEVKGLYQRWLSETKETGNVGQFAKWLVASKYVTEYQAALLLKGHADDFFLNQYQILDRLGRGRMAGVYKAVHHLGQVVAIKVLPPSKSKNPQFLARFQREARLAMRLKHPNVVRAFQVGDARGLNYLVMEYLEGGTLDEVLQQRKKLPPAEGVRLIHQALLGLQHIHEQGMIHRDLKPANLMLVPPPGETTLKSTVKILDIGLGRAAFEEGEAADATELTGEGVLLGTPDYLAPEQARDPRAIDIRADIYSLGCVLYHALAGQPPFPDTNLLSQMVRHATETPRPLKDLTPSIPDGLQQIVNWMLAKKAEERYPTPQRAAQALQVFLVADSESVKQPGEEPQLRKFLTWLEAGSEGNGPEAATVVPAAAVPAAFAVPAVETAAVAVQAPVQAVPVQAVSATVPTPVPPRASPAVAPPPAAAEIRPKKHKQKPKHAVPAGKREVPRSASPVPAAVPAAAAVPLDFDVELVSVTGGHAGASPRRKATGLSRRDWLLLGIGAGSVILAGAVGMILAIVLKG